MYILLNNGHAKYVYNNRNFSSFPGQLSHISMKINDVQNLLRKQMILKGYRTCYFASIKFAPDVWGGDDCVMTIRLLHRL